MEAKDRILAGIDAFRKEAELVREIATWFVNGGSQRFRDKKGFEYTAALSQEWPEATDDEFHRAIEIAYSAIKSVRRATH